MDGGGVAERGPKAQGDEAPLLGAVALAIEVAVDVLHDFTRAFQWRECLGHGGRHPLAQVEVVAVDEFRLVGRGGGAHRGVGSQSPPTCVRRGHHRDEGRGLAGGEAHARPFFQPLVPLAKPGQRLDVVVAVDASHNHQWAARGVANPSHGVS